MPTRLTLLNPPRPTGAPAAGDLSRMFEVLAGGAGADLPFSGDDVTAGGESELQAVVVGDRETVDLPATMAASNYFANILRRARSGDTSPRLASNLEAFLRDNPERVWENSWVRFPRHLLGPAADRVFRTDLLADKADPGAGRRRDAGRFLLAQGAQEELRLPVSYLLKLALADTLQAGAGLPRPLAASGRRLLGHFLNDNTSPETFSFHVVPLVPGRGHGRDLARETSRRYLLSQVLAEYANTRFGLAASGQRAMVYCAPRTPVRQRELNELIADGFYRELFMSPCLSGWDRGEEKHRYMELCHQVLSRSQLQAVAKLREAGIISNNLVVLPSVSNTSLANNGTHVSLGSRRLTAALADPGSGFGPAEEKYTGDLAIKCVEHFLPLFVNTYSAAPARLGFSDFHPERALGFLAHELDYTHLRMLWRRWRKKADLSLCGHALTPFGPHWLDRGLSTAFGLRGDFVPDARLVDYPAALLSTRSSPALDGRPGNQERLKEDLAALGAFDADMPLYLFYRQRQFAAMGFSGFEGRHYSLFADIGRDLGHATILQTLVTAFAYRQMARGRLHHRQIPDDPVAESERRQFIFATALAVPTCYVRRGGRNLFLRRLLRRARGVRASRRYPGYLRVTVAAYQTALLDLLQEEAADLVEALGAAPTLEDLRQRLADPAGHSAAGRLTRGILDTLNARDPLRVPAREFNLAAERYYREDLRREQVGAALAELAADLAALAREGDPELRQALHQLLGGRDAATEVNRLGPLLLDGRADSTDLQRLAGLVLATVDQASRCAAAILERPLTRAPEPLLHRAR